MTTKTPEQIAYRQVESISEHVPLDEDAQSFWINQIREAIEADRAQRIAPDEALRIAREHGYIVKAWHEDDIRSQVKNTGLTDEQVDRIVEEAQASYFWHALEDCTDQDWELVYHAIDEARDSLNAGEARA